MWFITHMKKKNFFSFFFFWFCTGKCFVWKPLTKSRSSSGSSGKNIKKKGFSHVLFCCSTLNLKQNDRPTKIVFLTSKLLLLESSNSRTKIKYLLAWRNKYIFFWWNFNSGTKKKKVFPRKDKKVHIYNKKFINWKLRNLLRRSKIPFGFKAN